MARHKSNLLLRPGVELEKWRETALHSMESRGRDRDRVFPIIHVKVLARVAFACYGEILEALLRSIEIFQLVLDAFHKGKSKVFACFFFFFAPRRGKARSSFVINGFFRESCFE